MIFLRAFLLFSEIIGHLATVFERMDAKTIYAEVVISGIYQPASALVWMKTIILTLTLRYF